jgi:UDP-3-O-[3-hydroxymyristoyl] glucosamine N-acyltransferase
MTRRYSVDDARTFAGEDVRIVGDAEGSAFVRAGSVDDADSETIVWIRPTREDKNELLASTDAQVVICDESVDIKAAVAAGKCLIIAKNPKVVFSRIVAGLFGPRQDWAIHPSSVIHPEAALAQRVAIGPNCSIGRAEIGEGTVIDGNCYVYDGVRIGRNVTIHAGTVIGSDGFGYERDASGEVAKFPHVGGVIIEDDVEIHSCTTIDRGSLSDTWIRRGAKIDNLVHVAHNTDIGEGTFVIAHAMLGGSVQIGRNCWIGPGAIIRDNLSIGDEAFIGIGALVVKDVPGKTVQMGAPAREADEYKALLQAFRELIRS